jgi:7,8-dihydropterin-6-yl-methyl-4-(beta-D-ribofuranosyl)aminobenzene 5'-phosphate synthase
LSALSRSDLRYLHISSYSEGLIHNFLANFPPIVKNTRRVRKIRVNALKGLKITVLCDNVVGNIRGVGEHGFAAYVETAEGNYLFDTGSGYGILHNARVFKKGLDHIRAVILSHGHYDHTGGLSAVVEAASPATIYAHPAVFDKKFVFSEEDGREVRRFIGMPHRRMMLESLGASFDLDRRFREIGRGIYATGEIPRVTEFEKGESRFFAKRGDLFLHDSVPDDQALVFNTERGAVVLLGCAHAGTINTLRYARDTLRFDRFLAVIGGTHLGLNGEEQVAASTRALKEMDVATLGVAHCTGVAVAHRLMTELGDHCFYASVGTTFEA